MIIPSLTEVIIVACGFGIVGLYMFIAHTIVKSGEKSDSQQPQPRHSH